MAKFALIENGIVTQIQTKDATGFVEVPDAVFCGMILEGEVFVSPPPNTDQTRRGEILAALDDIDRRTIRPLRAGESDMIAELEAQAEALREELRGMQ